ncbi:MAG: metallophosphoesterase [Comamonas sp.]|nr:metallophosphoesterase [Comamonas sp.]
MKLALFSDIHANIQALQACMEHARSQGATQLAFLGDLVGYGGSPAAVLDTIMHAVKEGAWIVRGNHDDLALHPPSHIQHTGEQGAQWTHDQLAPVHTQFLAQLPLLDQHGSVLLVHASAHRPERWPYVENSVMAERSMTAASDIDASIRYVFSGHVHQQSLYYLTPTAKLMRFVPQPGVPIPVPTHRQWLAIVGSCGQPRDGDLRAMYALYDDSAATMTFHRIPYDHAGAIEAVHNSGMPRTFAERLEQGR